MKFPFKEEKNKNDIIRTFDQSIDSEELIWHRDKKDRIIKIIENGGWKFQFDNELPIEIPQNQILFVRKEDWHRVLKGDGNLMVKIKEIN